MAVPELKAAEMLWKARDIVASYLTAEPAGPLQRAAGPA